jgi:hypothetical protein
MLSWSITFLVIGLIAGILGIKQHGWPDATDSKVPQAQAQEPGKTPPTAQMEGSPKPSKDRQP